MCALLCYSPYMHELAGCTFISCQYCKPADLEESCISTQFREEIEKLVISYNMRPYTSIDI